MKRKWKRKAVLGIKRGDIFDVKFVLIDLDLKVFIRQTSFLDNKISCYYVRSRWKVYKWILRELRRILCWELGDFQWLSIVISEGFLFGIRFDKKYYDMKIDFLMKKKMLQSNLI